jgi:hypothetical protein
MAALLNPHEALDTGSLTINAGGNLVCTLENVSWDATPERSDVRSLCGQGMRGQRTGRQATLSLKALIEASTGVISSDIDLTSLTVGGVTVLPQTYSFSLSGAYDKSRLPGIGVSGISEGVTGKSFSGSIELQIDDTDVVQTLVIASEGSSGASAQAILSFTINGTIVAFPVELVGNAHVLNQGAYQRVTLRFESQAPNRGTTFPTTPASLPGTPGLLDYFLISPRSLLAFVFSSKATHGLLRTGNLRCDAFSIGVTDGAINDFSYTLKTDGDWTTANNGP